MDCTFFCIAVNTTYNTGTTITVTINYRKDNYLQLQWYNVQLLTLLILLNNTVQLQNLQNNIYIYPLSYDTYSTYNIIV